MKSKILKRKIAGKILKSPKSVLLLGPRQVGKSTLIEQLKPDMNINLANEMDWMVLKNLVCEIWERACL